MSQPRVLVAEDEMIVAFDLCDTVEEAGYVVEGPHPDVSSAMLAVQKHKPDLAILDVRLDDGDSFTLAEHLIRDDVPVIFHSGNFTRREMEKRFPQALACEKPCPPASMLATVKQALSAH